MTPDPIYSCRTCGASWSAASDRCTAAADCWVAKDLRGRMRLLPVERDAAGEVVPLAACPYCQTRQPHGSRVRVVEVSE